MEEARAYGRGDQEYEGKGHIALAQGTGRMPSGRAVSPAVAPAGPAGQARGGRPSASNPFKKSVPREHDGPQVGAMDSIRSLGVMIPQSAPLSKTTSCLAPVFPSILIAS